MKLRECRHGRTTVFHLEGEIDTHYAPALRALFAAKASAQCPALVLDFGGVTFIDSTGIALVIEYLRDCSAFGGHFCIAGPTEPVRHILDIVQLAKALPIFDRVEHALAAMSAGCMPAPEQRLFGAVESESSVAA